MNQANMYCHGTNELIIINVLYSELCLKKNGVLNILEIHFKRMLTISELKIHCQTLKYFHCSPDRAEIQVESSWDMNAFLDIPLGTGMTATP